MAGYELKKKQLIKPDLQKLLVHLTGFEEDESKFKQCENFALSHFLHHTYLSVNRHQVQRSINGLINKFYVRGFTDKAKRLEMLVEKFVTSERYKDHEEVDVQWSILLFLMSLSENPTSMILQEDINHLPDLIPPDNETVSEAQPYVNWGDYLKEGWEEFQLPDDEVDSITWSDLENDDDFDELSQPLETTITFQRTEKSVSSDVSISSDKKSESIESHLKPLERDFESECDLKMKDYEQRLLSESWLKQNLQYDWWNDTSVRMKPNSNLPSARFAIIWEEHEHKHTQGLIPLGSISLISEYKLIREVLWVLQVPNDTFMFHLTNDGRILPRDNISIPSVTPESLSSYLKANVCYYAEIIYSLTQFIADIEKAEFEPKKPPYTYQTYAQTVQEQLLRIFASVAKIEEKVNVQETTCTLVSVIEELRPSLSKLPYMDCLHKMAVCDWRRSEGWFSSTRLLATLYEEVYFSWKDEFAAIAMELFVKSFRVYLQIIDLWLSEGKLDDWRDEFIIKRFDGALRTVAYEAALKEIKKTRIIEIFSMVEKAGCDLEYIRKLDEISVLSTKVENKGCLCKEFLEALDRDLSRFNSTLDSESEEPPRSSEIVLGISNSASYLEETKSNFNESCHRLRHSATLPSLSLPASELDSSWYDLATKNLLSSPWLDMSFRFLLSSEKRQTVLSKDEYRDTVGKYSSKDIGTLPLHHIIEKNIVHLFMERRRIASKIMVETLLTKYKLKQHLAVLGGVFVLEASYIVQRFYKRLFSPITPNNIERAEYSMDVVLEECVESITTQEFAAGIHFSVNFIENPNLISHNIIECINIDYKVDLPLSIIITKESLLIYNSVFKFLLKIEWALSSLHEPRFSDLKETKSNQERIRLLYKLRMFLMHCVTTLHSYFVAFTPKELRSELEQALDQASTVDEILNAHDTYLRKLKTHCLMDKGNIIMKAVKKLLIMCGDLKSYWIKESEGALTTDELSVLEEDYTKAHVRLHIVLKHTVGQHSNSSLRLLSSDIERCLPVSPLSFIGQGDQAFQVDN